MCFSGVAVACRLILLAVKCGKPAESLSCRIGSRVLRQHKPGTLASVDMAMIGVRIPEQQRWPSTRPAPFKAQADVNLALSGRGRGPSSSVIDDDEGIEQNRKTIFTQHDEMRAVVAVFVNAAMAALGVYERNMPLTMTVQLTLCRSAQAHNQQCSGITSLVLKRGHRGT